MSVGTKKDTCTNTIQNEALIPCQPVHHLSMSPPRTQSTQRYGETYTSCRTPPTNSRTSARQLTKLALTPASSVPAGFQLSSSRPTSGSTSADRRFASTFAPVVCNLCQNSASLIAADAHTDSDEPSVDAIAEVVVDRCSHVRTVNVNGCSLLDGFVPSLCKFARNSVRG